VPTTLDCYLNFKNRKSFSIPRQRYWFKPICTATRALEKSAKVHRRQSMTTREKIILAASLKWGPYLSGVFTNSWRKEVFWCGVLMMARWWPCKSLPLSICPANIVECEVCVDNVIISIFLKRRQKLCLIRLIKEKVYMNIKVATIKAYSSV
jgi:hypothetical protein